MSCDAARLVRFACRTADQTPQYVHNIMSDCAARKAAYQVIQHVHKVIFDGAAQATIVEHHNLVPAVR